MNTILDKEYLYFYEIQSTVIATGLQNELKFNFMVINDHIKWLIIKKYTSKLTLRECLNRLLFSLGYYGPKVSPNITNKAL